MTSHDAAVVDVGSNSVRLVLYRVEGRSMWTVFNEKVLAGLGRDLKKTGRLSEDGAASALSALKRFRMVVERPPEGVGRGILPVPPALVVVVSAAIVSAVIFHLLLRARRR